MLTRMYFFPSALALTFFASAACAQRKVSKFPDDHDVASAGPASDSAIAARPIPKITSTYDAKFDRTIFRVSIPSVAPGTELSITAKQLGRGTVIPADSVELFLTHVGSERRFRKGDDLDILLDGKSFLVIESLDVTVKKMGEVYVEQAAVPVSLADYVTIANANVAGARFGKFNFWLAGAQLDVLRAFAIRVGVIPARSR